MTEPLHPTIKRRVPNWRNVLALDFPTDRAMGTVLDSDSPYFGRLSAYKTGTPTSGPWHNGIYDNRRLEVVDGVLKLHIATVDGKPRTAALRPRMPAKLMAGRFTTCFRIPKPIPGYKIAWLLWPDSGDWPHAGEIDFPEASLDPDKATFGYMHRQDGRSGDDQSWARSEARMTDGEWHIATINWKSGSWETPRCEFVLDGQRIGLFTDRVPKGPMHWVIQTEPKLSTTLPPVDAEGVIEWAWFTGFIPS